MINKLIVITGPTSIGKTDISIYLGKHYNGEIINADASQFRKGLNIGTAKINVNEVDVPHHLIDIIEIEDSFSIKDFQTLARKKIADLQKNNILPILVGGSGLYINSVIGNYELDNESRDITKEDELYNELNNESLHNELKLLDYEASLNIHPNNRRRVLRAIQRAKEGFKVSSKTEGSNIIYDCIIIQLTAPREVLYERINRRFDVMIENGWLDEVKTLRTKGIDLIRIKDIGYSELSLYLDGLISYEEVKEEIKKKTRNYAKRQITWFKNKMNTHEVNMNYQNIDETIINIKNIIDEYLNKNIF